MIVRLVDICNGCVFSVGNRDFIKLDEFDDKVIAINCSSLADVNLNTKHKILDQSQIFGASLIDVDEDGIYHSRDFINVRTFAKYKDLLLPHINDSWYIEWSNKEQGRNGDYCYVDPAGNYHIVTKSDDVSQINGNGTMKIRALHIFDPDTLVRID